MAEKSTILKVALEVADVDRGYYGSHALTLARHPSETDERTMVRLLAFALFAGERLEFGRGLSTQDEPDLWVRDLTGAIELWIDVGLPDERAVRRACGRSREVAVVAYGGRAVDLWWSSAGEGLRRSRNLEVVAIPPSVTEPLAGLAARSMSLQVNVHDGEVSILSERATFAFEPARLLTAAPRRGHS
jgi:uncharacterized protein YaeQ